MYALVSKKKRIAIIEDTSKEKVYGVISGWQYPRKIIDVKNLGKYIKET